MIPVRDNPRFYNELISLYSAREKGLYAEEGGYYDQPNVYSSLMSAIDSAVSETMDMEATKEAENKAEIDSMKNLGLNILPARTKK
jgi:hypothetical protein